MHASTGAEPLAPPPGCATGHENVNGLVAPGLANVRRAKLPLIAARRSARARCRRLRMRLCCGTRSSRRRSSPGALRRAENALFALGDLPSNDALLPVGSCCVRPCPHDTETQIAFNNEHQRRDPKSYYLGAIQLLPTPAFRTHPPQRHPHPPRPPPMRTSDRGSRPGAES